MAKEQLKNRIREQQNNQCELLKVQLPDENVLIDTDRITMKMEGGTYTDDNTRLVMPLAHMIRHNNFRIREHQMHELKKMVDERNQIMKLLNSCENRLRAYKRRTDDLNEETINWLENQAKEVKKEKLRKERIIEKHVSKMNHPMVEKAVKIKGVGYLTIALMLVYVDIEKARYASSLWSYAGLHCPSYERYNKGEAGGGNKTLRTALYVASESWIKHRNIYREIYDNEKRKLEASEKETWSRNTQGKWVKVKWKDTKPCHRADAARRKMIKHFLADWWKVHREAFGLDTPMLYPEAKLGHKGIVQPSERGWGV